MCDKLDYDGLKQNVKSGRCAKIIPLVTLPTRFKGHNLSDQVTAI